jgi:hypothetical protein
MSISISVSGVLAFSWMISTLLGGGAPRIATIFAIILAGIVEAVAGNILYQERAGIGNRVRELVILLILTYVVLSVSAAGPLSRRFEPGFSQIPGLIAVSICWLVAFAFHNRLRGRESLLRAYAGKRKEELRRAVLYRQHDMALTVGQLRRARGLIVWLFVLLCGIGIVGTFRFMPSERLSATSGAFVTLVIYGIVSIAVIGALNLFIEEYAANGEGLAVPLRMGRIRGFLVVIVVAVSVVIAFLMSRNESLLPIEVFPRLAEWFGSLFQRRQPRAVDQQLPVPPVPQLSPDVMRDLQGMEPVVPPVWVRLLAAIVRRLVLAAAVLFAAVLVFGPLFSPSFRKGVASLRPKAFLRRLWSLIKTRLKMLRHAIRLFFQHGFGRSKGAAGVDGEGGRSSGSRFVRWRPSVRKKRQMNRVVTVFAAVAKWGGRNGVPYVPTLAATEYLRRIATVRPEHYSDTRVVGDVFCRARFSRELVTRAEMSAYFKAAKRITRDD